MISSFPLEGDPTTARQNEAQTGMSRAAVPLALSNPRRAVDARLVDDCRDLLVTLPAKDDFLLHC